MTVKVLIIAAAAVATSLVDEKWLHIPRLIMGDCISDLCDVVDCGESPALVDEEGTRIKTMSSRDYIITP
jgi:hypothetical protein